MSVLPQGPLCRWCGHVMSAPDDLESGAHTACTIRRKELDRRANQT